jgi:ribonuclease-3
LNDALSQLQVRLQHSFKDASLLERAVTHRSYSADHNERLEFLGDSVLNLAVAHLLYKQLSDLPEGDLSRVRANLVKQDTLHHLAVEMGLPQRLRLGEGELRSGGQKRPSILADALEAVLGAVYLDAGPQATHDVVSALMGKRIVDAVGGLDRLDAKTRLQELASKLEAHVHYKVEDEGPDHEKMFFATVFVGDRELGYGEGKSKKAAEQIAAEIACDVLNSELPAS